MTITNRDYSRDLGNKESEEFKRLAEEVEMNVRTKLLALSQDFLNSMVEKFSEEGENVGCQLKISVLKTSSITAKQIKEALGSHLGNLTITDVTVVESDSSTTLEPATKSPSDEDLFKVTATITNKEYTEELRDSSSDKFKTLSGNLTEILTNVLKSKLSGFRRVEVIGFSEGSLICIFNIVTDITNEESSVREEKIRNILKDASSTGEMGDYSFGDIKVEKSKEKVMQTGTEDKKWPTWVIALISASGVMLILIFLMSYLVRILPGLISIEYYSWISREICSDDSLVVP